MFPYLHNMSLFTQMTGKQKKIYLAALLLSLTAVFVTILLIMAHYETSSSGSFCNIDDYWNCDRVNKSVFAEIFGIPVSILGFLYYIFVTIVFAGLWKGLDFVKALKPVTTGTLLKIGTGLAILSIIIMTALEAPLLGANFFVALIKGLVLLLLYIWIYRYASRKSSRHTELMGAVAILALFGVSFSLYLTDIELFVLHAICVYCFTQQVLIVIIFALSLLALQTSAHEHTKPTTGSH